MSRYLGRKILAGTPTRSTSFLRPTVTSQLHQLRTSAFSNSARSLASPAPPTEEEVFSIGRPTPEQEAQMKQEIAGGVPASKTFSPTDVHTVEDIHHLTAEEALAETGTRRDATLRHFTGESCVRRIRRRFWWLTT